MASSLHKELKKNLIIVCSFQTSFFWLPSHQRVFFHEHIFSWYQFARELRFTREIDKYITTILQFSLSLSTIKYLFVTLWCLIDSEKHHLFKPNIVCDYLYATCVTELLQEVWNSSEKTMIINSFKSWTRGGTNSLLQEKTALSCRVSQNGSR